jgi:hypothetical protein
MLPRHQDELTQMAEHSTILEALAGPSTFVGLRGLLDDFNQRPYPVGREKSILPMPIGLEIRAWLVNSLPIVTEQRLQSPFLFWTGSAITPCHLLFRL